jgi:hypothetical protein
MYAQCTTEHDRRLVFCAGMRANFGNGAMAQTRKLYLSIWIQLVLAMVVGLAPLYAQEVDRTQLPIPDTQYKYPGEIPLTRGKQNFRRSKN